MTPIRLGDEALHLALAAEGRQRSNQVGTRDLKDDSGHLTAEHCPVCLGPREVCFRSTVLNKYDVRYLMCPACGFLQTERPYWLEEAYSSPISEIDTGIIARNVATAQKLACILFFLFNRSATYLDVAGGYALLTRLMRDIGFNFYWSDPYCENIFAKGFEAGKASEPFSAVTAFEVLEHIYDPLGFIRQTLDDAPASTMIFSTELFDGAPPPVDSWWYYAFAGGQHISFYQTRTLEVLARRLGLLVYTCNGFHILTATPIHQSILRLISGPLWRGLHIYVRRRMKPKTFSDHESLTKLLALGGTGDG